MATPQLDTDILSLSKELIHYVQSVVGYLLYYARAIDDTMLPELNDISREQSNPSTKTLDKCQQLLDYANTYKHVEVQFCARVLWS